VNHTINYPIEIRETLIGAKIVETKGPKQHGVHGESNPALED